MTGLILGLVVGACIGGLWLLWWLLIDNLEPYGSRLEDESKQKKYQRNLKICKALKKLVILSAIFIFLCSAPIGISLERHESRKWCESYIAYKLTFETSMDSELLSGLERIELVSKAAQTNSDLAAKQYSCRQWYGFGHDKMVLDLEPINL